MIAQTTLPANERRMRFLEAVQELQGRGWTYEDIAQVSDYANGNTVAAVVSDCKQGTVAPAMDKLHHLEEALKRVRVGAQPEPPQPDTGEAKAGALGREQRRRRFLAVVPRLEEAGVDRSTLADVTGYANAGSFGAALRAARDARSVPPEARVQALEQLATEQLPTPGEGNHQWLRAGFDQAHTAISFDEFVWFYRELERLREEGGYSLVRLAQLCAYKSDSSVARILNDGVPPTKSHYQAFREWYYQGDQATAPAEDQPTPPKAQPGQQTVAERMAAIQDDAYALADRLNAMLEELPPFLRRPVLHRIEELEVWAFQLLAGEE